MEGVPVPTHSRTLSHTHTHICKFTQTLAFFLRAAGMGPCHAAADASDGESENEWGKKEGVGREVARWPQALKMKPPSHPFAL